MTVNTDTHSLAFNFRRLTRFQDAHIRFSCFTLYFGQGGVAGNVVWQLCGDDLLAQ